jgi:dephospho-CoA kinase
MNRPRVVGLTGGIASGKSTVAERFMELGVPVIDADVASRTVVQRGKPALAQIATRFGANVIGADGELNRAALRSHIFNDPAERRALEQILHPLIRDQMSAEAAAVNKPYLVMAIPLLVEGGSAHERVERVLVVDVPEDLQIGRLLARDGVSLDQAQAILASQARRADRLVVADDVLTNTGSVTDLRQSVDRLHAQYLHWAGATEGLP